MAKWISKGAGKWEPGNDAAKLAQVKKDKRIGKASVSDLKEAEDKAKSKIESAEALERLRVAKEAKEREEKAAKAYVPPTPRVGANAKFRERNKNA